MAIYDKPVRQLMHEMADDFHLEDGDTFDRQRAVEWFRSRYPLIKEGTVTAHLIRLSTNARSRLHYKPHADGSDDVFFQTQSGQFRLYDSATDPAPFRLGSESAASEGLESAQVDPASSEFAYEHDLRDYLARNLHLVEPGIQLYQQEGVTGVEFPAGGRFIDILAVDPAGAYVVIELKVSKGYDRVVGQLLRYIGWVRQHHADAGQTVRGAIVAKTISSDLRLACSALPDIKLFESSLAVSLKAVPAIDA